MAAFGKFTEFHPAVKVLLASLACRSGDRATRPKVHRHERQALPEASPRTHAQTMAVDGEASPCTSGSEVRLAVREGRQRHDAKCKEQLNMTTSSDPFLDALSRILSLPREFWDGAKGSLRAALVESGLSLALVPEEQGGGGLGWAQAWPILVLLGKARPDEPLAEALVAQWLLAGSGLEPVQGLPVIAGDVSEKLIELRKGSSGSWQAFGKLARVPWGSDADAIVTVGTFEGQSFTVCIPQAASEQVVRQVRPARNLAGEPRDDVILEGIVVQCAPAPIDAVGLRAIAAVVRAAQMTGSLAHCLELAVEYSKLRQQFGRPLAAFQAIQQALARLATQVAASIAASQAALDAIDASLRERDGVRPSLSESIHPAIAKIRVGEAAGVGSAIVHQIFGSIGFTREHELHSLTTRLLAWRDEFGNEAFWSRQLGQHLADGTELTVWQRVTSDRWSSSHGESTVSGHLLEMPRPALTRELDELRSQVREFLSSHLQNRSYSFFGEFDPAFSEALGRRGWIGMAIPRRYGGGERSVLARHVVLEELLVARAPVYAHSVADRQSGQLLMKFGQEWMRRDILPRIAAGTCYFCIGMSEPGSGSDLASARTRAERVAGGYRVTGSKIWTSSAHRSDYMILLCRTGPAGASRHEGLTQLLVDMKNTTGVTCRPIVNMAGETDFNEVFFDDAFIGDEMLIGTEGSAWAQVTSELSFERSGPERFLSSYGLLEELALWLRSSSRQNRPEAWHAATQALGRLTAHLATLRRMSRSIATMLDEGDEPALQACIVKDLGTVFEQEVPEVVRLIVETEPDAESHDALTAGLSEVMLRAPSFTIRGGTTEVLRGIIARGVGVR